VHEIRKSQFENFIHGIIRDIEPQELNLPTFGRKKSKPEVNNKKLNVETPGLPYVQETFYDGYKLKSEPSLSESATIPVKNGKYPCYVHTYPDLSDEDDYQFNFVKIVVEGIENCYLNRNSKGQVFFDKSFRKSLFLREHINKKSNKISIDRIDLRNSETLKELEKISFVEEIELHGFKNIKNWDGLSKLKNLKKLKLVSCDVSFSTTENFFKNLYSLKNLEEFTIDDTCDIPRPNKSKFPKDLYLKKLKSFKIDFREEWKKSDHESYPKHKGYGNDKVWFICSHLPNIYQFPNFEKFKSLEKLRIYNYFDPDQKEGSLFNYEYGFEDYYQSINQLCKNSKIKDIWIYGYNFKQSNELASTRFLDAVLKLTKDTTVKVNGINKNTLKNISEKPISSTSVKINRLELVCKVEEIYDPKLISHENDKVVLNYFANIQDNENRGLLNDCFSQDIEEIVINPTYQFIRSEMDYVDTYAPLKEHLKRNKKLKKIIFKFDENDVSGDYGGMSGYWGDYESTFFNNIISELLTKYPNLKIILQHDSFNEALTNNTKIGFYIKIFEMFRILNENTKTKNRFEILGFNINSISKILEKYFLDIVDTLVVIEDNMGWNESKDIRDIEFFDKYKNFESPNPFPINLGTKNIELSYEGTKPYIKESKFINRMFEHETFWSFADNKYYHFLNDKIEGYDADKPIIIVKQKYLDRTKSTIFKNIKHYFYFAEVDYTSDEYDNIHYKKFWKDKEYFKFPKSVKFNKLETLNIFGGRDVKLNNLVYQVDCSNLKQLILCRCIDKDRTFPILPNLENLIIENKYTQKAKPYSKLSNLPKIKHLEFLVLFNYNDTNSRWNAAEFDFTDIYKLSNLSYLKMRSVNPEYMPPLKTLKNLEELELSFKLITGDMGSDDGIINENLADKDFEFLHHLKKLKKLDLDIPHDESDIIGPLLLSYVNPGIEELVLDLHYYDQDINNGYETIKYITKHLKNLRKLKLIMGRKEKFETSRKKKFIYFRKTGEKWEEGKEGPRPFILDLNKFTSLKKLEKIEFRQYWEDDMGYKVINPIKITKLRKIKKIIIDDNKFSSEDLIKIRNITEGPRDKFLEACKKKDKSIKNEYSLSKKDKKKYDLLDKREIKFNGTYDYDWSGDTIEDILKKRKRFPKYH
jgi:hypothetical protein